MKYVFLFKAASCAIMFRSSSHEKGPLGIVADGHISVLSDDKDKELVEHLLASPEFGLKYIAFSNGRKAGDKDQASQQVKLDEAKLARLIDTVISVTNDGIPLERIAVAIGSKAATLGGVVADLVLGGWSVV